MNDIKATVSQNSDTDRSSTTLPLKQNDLKIIIEDFSDKKNKTQISKINKASIDVIETRIEELKKLTKKNKVSGDISSYYTCHSCHSLLERKYLVQCTDKECARYFCLRCSNKRYHSSPEEIYEIINSDSWNCYSCKGCKISPPLYLMDRCKDRFYGKTEFFPAELITFERAKKKQHLKKESDEPITVKEEGESKEVLEEPEVNMDLSSDKKNEEKQGEEPIIKKEKQKPFSEKQSKKERPHKAQLKKKEGKSTKSEEPEPITNKSKDSQIEEPSSNEIKMKYKGRLKRLVRIDEDEELDQDESQNGSESTKDENTPLEEKPTFPKKGRRGGFKKRNTEDGSKECHLCENIYEDINMMKCSLPNCRKFFCVFCIQSRFERNFDIQKGRLQLWVCYPCQKLCKCPKCLMKPARITALKRRAMKGEARTGGHRRKGRARRKFTEKKQIRYYDNLSDKNAQLDIEFEEPVSMGLVLQPGELIEVPEIQPDLSVMEYNKDLEEEVDSDNEEKQHNKFLEKKKRLKKGLTFTKKDIDNSKIITEINIDSTCITLYAFENEDELKAEIQRKIETEE